MISSAKATHKGGAEASTCDLCDRTLHRKTKILGDLDRKMPPRHVHRNRAFHQPEPDSSACGGAWGGTGGLGFTGPTCPDQNKELCGACRYGELNIRSLWKQSMIL